MKKFLIGLVAVLLFLLALSWFIGSALWVGSAAAPVPLTSARAVSESATLPRPLSASISTPLSAAPSTRTEKQILFGDLHVHTSYSLDAALFGTPAVKGNGYYSPADACDFARYCSSLDFWSINDHAEGLTPDQWRDTKQAIRQCNAATDPANPDMVAFLGWEWSHNALNPEEHYGHKNVLFRDTADDAVPARPIASTPSPWRALGNAPTPLRGLGLLAASKVTGLADYGSLAAHLQNLNGTPDCAVAPVRELPDDCFETAATPQELFAKLDEWDFPALVIPHGLAWGTTNPAGADFARQLDQHNPRYQKLLEVYSGHGNSEVYRDLSVPIPGQAECPAPANGFTPCCWRAGEIIRNRCDDPGSAACAEDMRKAREFYQAADTGMPFSAPRAVVAETGPDDWGQCDQLTDSFQAAFNYRPLNSAQYILSIGDNNNRANPNRMRVGFIASSDNHTARAGSGYKEVARYSMTDSRDKPHKLSTPSSPPPAKPVDPRDFSLLAALEPGGRKDAFYFTGGLVAVHSAGRDRQSIWDALQRREVYGTSGPRIALWFDLIDRQGEAHPMGSELWSVGNPRFRVRALGSFRQKPGCPADNIDAMGAQRIDHLCRGECYNPGDERHSIRRIEVVRVLPQFHPGENTAELIQDPWRTFDCDPAGDVCEAEFTDKEFGSLGREVVYYARAIQEDTPTINGDPFRCDYDAAGNCIKTNYCLGVPATEDCLSPAQHRAWSSPIFVQFAGE
jgi:hypothetical protein